jgi:hypothetical protein
MHSCPTACRKEGAQPTVLPTEGLTVVRRRGRPTLESSPSVLLRTLTPLPYCTTATYSKSRAVLQGRVLSRAVGTYVLCVSWGDHAIERPTVTAHPLTYGMTVGRAPINGRHALVVHPLSVLALL